MNQLYVGHCTGMCPWLNTTEGTEVCQKATLAICNVIPQKTIKLQLTKKVYQTMVQDDVRVAVLQICSWIITLSTEVNPELAQTRRRPARHLSTQTSFSRV